MKYEIKIIVETEEEVDLSVLLDWANEYAAEHIMEHLIHDSLVIDVDCSVGFPEKDAVRTLVLDKIRRLEDSFMPAVLQYLNATISFYRETLPVDNMNSEQLIDHIMSNIFSPNIG